MYLTRVRTYDHLFLPAGGCLSRKYLFQLIGRSGQLLWLMGFANKEDLLKSLDLNFTLLGGGVELCTSKNL